VLREGGILASRISLADDDDACAAYLTFSICKENVKNVHTLRRCGQVRQPPRMVFFVVYVVGKKKTTKGLPIFIFLFLLLFLSSESMLHEGVHRGTEQTR